jgi:hypothetical protein
MYSPNSPRAQDYDDTPCVNGHSILIDCPRHPDRSLYYFISNSSEQQILTRYLDRRCTEREDMAKQDGISVDTKPSSLYFRQTRGYRAQCFPQKKKEALPY